MEEYTVKDLEKQYEKIVGEKIDKDNSLILRGLPEDTYVKYLKNAIYRKKDIFTANPEILGEDEIRNLY